MSRRLTEWGLVLILIAGISSCDIFSPVEEPVFDNPRDPQSPNAQPPSAAITNHSDGASIQDNTIELQWAPDDSEEGVTENLEYQYRLAAAGENIDNKEFSSWTTNTSISYQYLNESFADEEYMFEIRARSEDNEDLVQSEEEATELAFSVDAIPDGPVFSPRKLTNTEGNIYVTELYLHSISSSDGVSAIQLEVNYPSADVSIDSVAIYEEDSFLAKANGDLITFDDAPQSGTRLINIGILGGDLSQLSGYGAVAKFYFTASDLSSGPFEISLGNETTFYYQDNSTETFNTLDKAVITN